MSTGRTVLATATGTLSDLYATAAELDQAPFLEELDGSVWSYGDVRGIAERYVAGWRAQGLVRGDRVAAAVDKGPAAVSLYLAAVTAGLIYVPLNPRATLAELRFLLSDAAARLVFCSASNETVVRAAAESLPLGLEVLAKAARCDVRATLRKLVLATERLTPADPAAILYTSGTTGRPKAAVMTHGALMANALDLIAVWEMRRDDTLLHALPLFHTHGLFVALNTCILVGAKAVLLPQFDEADVLAVLPRCSVMMGVPTFYARLLRRSDFTRDATSAVRLFVSGSAPLEAGLYSAFLERTGHEIVERYGMTETGIIASTRIGETKPGCVGRPLPTVEVRLARETRDATFGVVEVRGPSLFAGYADPAEKGMPRRDGAEFFVTGDIGSVDDGGMLRLIGRTSDVIITGGFNVYPKEVEAAIGLLDSVEEACAFSLPDDDLGQCVAAALVVKPGAVLVEEEVREHVRSVLSRYKVPGRVIFLERLPRNFMGKVDRTALRHAAFSRV